MSTNLKLKLLLGGEDIRRITIPNNATYAEFVAACETCAHGAWYETHLAAREHDHEGGSWVEYASPPLPTVSLALADCGQDITEEVWEKASSLASGNHLRIKVTSEASPHTRPAPPTTTTRAAEPTACGAGPEDADVCTDNFSSNQHFLPHWAKEDLLCADDRSDAGAGSAAMSAFVLVEADADATSTKDEEEKEEEEEEERMQKASTEIYNSDSDADADADTAAANSESSAVACAHTAKGEVEEEGAYSCMYARKRLPAFTREQLQQLAKARSAQSKVQSDTNAHADTGGTSAEAMPAAYQAAPEPEPEPEETSSEETASTTSSAQAAKHINGAPTPSPTTMEPSARAAAPTATATATSGSAAGNLLSLLIKRFGTLDKQKPSSIPEKLNAAKRSVNMLKAALSHTVGASPPTVVKVARDAAVQAHLSQSVQVYAELVQSCLLDHVTEDEGAAASDVLERRSLNKQVEALVGRVVSSAA